MNRAIRRVGIAVVALLLVLVVQLTWLQVVDSHHLDHDPRNVRSVLCDINRPRGDILSADGEVLARSRAVRDGTQFQYQREYPLGGLTAQDRRSLDQIGAHASAPSVPSSVSAGSMPLSSR